MLSLMTDEEKAEDEELVLAVVGAMLGGTGLGMSTDSRLRDRLRYSSNDTCKNR